MPVVVLILDRRPLAADESGRQRLEFRLDGFREDLFFLLHDERVAQIPETAHRLVQVAGGGRRASHCRVEVHAQQADVQGGCAAP
jgi:hypothetical protein